MGKRPLSSKGFSLTELLAVCSVPLLFAACPGYPVRIPGPGSSVQTEMENLGRSLRIWTGGKAQEQEVKANLHTIQVALERYMTDNGEYPPYLLGGDVQGWSAWHDKWDGVNDTDMPSDRTASNAKVRDPLLDSGYMSSYPANPFLDDGRKVIETTNADGSGEPGSGDPRFGFSGDLMGMGLDDINYFKGAIQQTPYFWSDIETRRTLDHGEWMKVPDYFKNPETNMYYLFGGRRSFGADGPIFTFWPGNFFYKSTPDVILPGRSGWSFPHPNTNDVGGPRTRYILGGYGAEGTVGLDVIRLEYASPDGSRLNWRTPPPYTADYFQCGYENTMYGMRSPGGLPEVFGGGDETTGPWWYYNEGGRNSGDFIYGAPDGVPDGVILVLTDGSNVFSEYGAVEGREDDLND